MATNNHEIVNIRLIYERLIMSDDDIAKQTLQHSPKPMYKQRHMYTFIQKINSHRLSRELAQYTRVADTTWKVKP